MAVSVELIRRGSVTVMNLGGSGDAALIVEVVRALQRVEGDGTVLIVDLNEVVFSNGEFLCRLLESLECLNVDRRLQFVPHTAGRAPQPPVNA